MYRLRLLHLGQYLLVKGLNFVVGGHAEAVGISLLTRDTRRLITYFPGVTLICPQQAD